MEIFMIKLQNISFEHKHMKILENFNVEFEPKSIVSILGPSGVGKSTLLKLLSGLILPSSGRIVIDNEIIKGPSYKRVIVFQDHLIFPWMSSKQNIEFVLKATNQDLKFAHHYLNLVKLNDAKDLYPHELSGGMKQRIGIARALAAKPDILLLDEPFASLDAITRDKLIYEMLEVIKNIGITAFFVSHNIEEAVFLSNRIVLLNQNKSAFDLDLKINFEKAKNILDLKHQKEFIEIEKNIYTNLQRI
jgi:ABC-type nitrate/sulfonate/bicarbonate transport system ATPase subunit